MKRVVLGVGLVVLMLAVPSAVLADQIHWGVNIKVVGGRNAGFGTFSNASDDWSTSGDNIPPNDATQTFGTNKKYVCSDLIPAVSGITTEDWRAPIVTTTKTWSLRIAASTGTTSGDCTIGVYEKWRDGNATYDGVYYDPGYWDWPPAVINGCPMTYKLVMVNNRGKQGAPANGTTYDIGSDPGTTNPSITVTLPLLVLTVNDRAHMFSEGYVMEFQARTPEPGTLALLGLVTSGLLGIRRRPRR